MKNRLAKLPEINHISTNSYLTEVLNEMRGTDKADISETGFANRNVIGNAWGRANLKQTNTN